MHEQSVRTDKNTLLRKLCLRPTHEFNGMSAFSKAGIPHGQPAIHLVRPFSIDTAEYMPQSCGKRFTLRPHLAALKHGRKVYIQTVAQEMQRAFPCIFYVVNGANARAGYDGCMSVAAGTGLNTPASLSSKHRQRTIGDLLFFLYACLFLMPQNECRSLSAMQIATISRFRHTNALLHLIFTVRLS